MIGLALRDIVPWWFAVILPLRDVLLWGLVPILRTRGYSALPVHFLGQGRDLQPALRLPPAPARRRHRRGRDAGQGVRLGLRGLGDRALLVGRHPLRLPGLQAGEVDRAPGGGPWLRPRPPTAGPRPEQTMPLLTLITQRSLDADYEYVAARKRAAGAGPVRHASSPRRTAAIVLLAFGLLVTVAAVQTSRNASVDAGQPQQPDRPDQPAAASRSPTCNDSCPRQQAASSRCNAR